jgi:hypothetical protein
MAAEKVTPPLPVAPSYDPSLNAASTKQSPADPRPLDLESHTQAQDEDTTMDGLLRFIDYFHPMGPSTLARPPSSADITRRRFASVILSCVLVGLAGQPFTPFSSLLGRYHVYVVDLVVSNCALAAACYFHFRLASLTEGVAAGWRFGSRFRMVVRDGRLQRVDADPIKWLPEYYWPKLLMEVFFIAFSQSMFPEVVTPNVCVVILVFDRCSWGWSMWKMERHNM